MHIDAVFAVGEVTQQARRFARDVPTSVNGDAAVPPELELTFDSVWEVIRPHGTLEPKAENQLRLALARRLVILVNSGVTQARELRRQAIEHFLLER